MLANAVIIQVCLSYKKYLLESCSACNAQCHFFGHNESNKEECLTHPEHDKFTADKLTKEVEKLLSPLHTWVNGSDVIPYV